MFTPQKRIHCIGIGGIGLSALAQYYQSLGYDVTGSDMQASKVTDMLVSHGIRVMFGHDAAYIAGDIESIFYSPAIPENNVELVAARAQNIPTYTYPQGLGMISKLKKTIAIAGTHGKTSTTAMIAHVLRTAHIDPTVIVGSLLAQDGTNFITGKSDVFVVEACEFKRSFHELSPWIAVITNIDNDHLDYYGTIENVVEAFRVFVEKVPSDGYVIVDRTLPYIESMLVGVSAHIIDVSSKSKDFELQIPGEHMRGNARLASAVAQMFDVEEANSTEILKTFAGTWRRSEYKGMTIGGAMVFDDYGHHPTEIRTTLAGFRERYQDKKIIVIFQPHLYSRTKILFHDFVNAFASVDEVYVAPIYAAREVDDGTITSDMLIEAIQKKGKTAYIFTDTNITTFKSAGINTVIITLGAGEMNLVAEKIVEVK